MIRLKLILLLCLPLIGWGQNDTNGWPLCWPKDTIYVDTNGTFLQKEIEL